MRATDTSGSELSYGINSGLFAVDNRTGGVYLLTWLAPTETSLQRYEHVEITVTDAHGRNKLSIRNRILVLNANTQPPRLLAPTNTYFELLEVNTSLLLCLHSIYNRID